MAHYIPPAGVVDSAGVFRATQRRVIQVVGPASYATGGFQVDASAFFSSIIAAVCVRRFVTASKAAFRSHNFISEAGTDLFADAKFRCEVSVNLVSHAHNYDKTDTPTGVNSNDSGLGAGAHTHPNTSTSTSTSTQGGGTTTIQEIAATTNLSASTFEFIVEGMPK